VIVESKRSVCTWEALGKLTDNLGHTHNVVVSSSCYCIVTHQSTAFITHLPNEAEP